MRQSATALMLTGAFLSLAAVSGIVYISYHLHTRRVPVEVKPGAQIETPIAGLRPGPYDVGVEYPSSASSDVRQDLGHLTGTAAVFCGDRMIRSTTLPVQRFTWDDSTAAMILFTFPAEAYQTYKV